MKPTPSRGCPLPAWAFSLALLLIELTLYAWLTRKGVQRGLFSDAVGGLLFLALPFLLRAVVCFLSLRAASHSFDDDARSQLRGRESFRFFLIEYVHFVKQTLLQLPFPVFWRTSGDRGDHRATGEVVLLQHGYAHCGAVWHSTAVALEREGYRVYTIDQPLFAPIDTMADRLAARVLDVLRATGAQKLTLVGHSMGGLIIRAYLRRYGGERVARVVTIGSPHHGTRHAMLAGGSNGRQMRVGGDWLHVLGRERLTVPFVSIYSIHDTVISPQVSSRLDGAEHRVIARVGHVSMPSGRATRAALLEALRASPP